MMVTTKDMISCLEDQATLKKIYQLNSVSDLMKVPTLFQELIFNHLESLVVRASWALLTIKEANLMLEEEE